MKNNRKRKRQAVGKPLNLPEYIGKAYARDIKAIAAAMVRDGNNAAIDLFMRQASPDLIAATMREIGNRYEQVFIEQVDAKSREMLAKVNTSSRIAVNSSLTSMVDNAARVDSFTVSPDFLKEGAFKDIFEAAVKENVALFKTIAPVHFQRVETAVINSITNGDGLKDLQPFLQNFSNGTRNYAKNRALDQTRKAYAAINQERLIRSGVKKLKWLHSHGSNAPRKLHQELDGQIFDIDKPPYIGDMYGQRLHGWGGLLPYCRCTVAPVWDFGDDE